MKKEKKIPKEYAAIVSLVIFFTVVTLVGGVRLFYVITASKATIDLNNIHILEANTNLDISGINLRLRNAISEEYGIDIYYGNNVNVSSVNAVNISDNEAIFNMLRDLNESLSKYPKGIIREIENKGYTVCIYLVDRFTNNIEALANRNSIGQFNIYISNSLDIKRAFHHEFYHILEYYIKLETYERFSEWVKYNPKGFEYTNDINNITSKYVYNGQNGAYFVTLYAKYSEKEDRAETFAEMLTANRMELFFSEGENIRLKIDLLNTVLKNTFQTVRNEEELFWE